MPSAPNPRTRGASLLTALIAAACAALIVLVLVLARQNTNLKAQLAEAEAAAALAARRIGPPATLVGTRLAEIATVDAQGARSTIRLDAPGRRLVMVGSVHCTTCQAVRPFWHEAAQWAAAAQVETLCLMTDAKPDPKDTETLGVPVYQALDFDSSSLRDLPLVPALLLLRNGTVEHQWLGEPSDAQRIELQAALRS